MKCVKMKEKEDLIPWLESKVIPEDSQRKNIKFIHIWGRLHEM